MKELNTYERAAMYDLMSAAQLNAQHNNGAKALHIMGSICGDPAGHVDEIRGLMFEAEQSQEKWRNQEVRWYKSALAVLGE